MVERTKNTENGRNTENVGKKRRQKERKKERNLDITKGIMEEDA